MTAPVDTRACECGHHMRWHTLTMLCVGNRLAAKGSGGPDCACTGYYPARRAAAEQVSPEAGT